MNKETLVRTLRFLFRHVEKFIAVAVVFAAIGLAARTLNYQPLTWKPDELETLANDVENTIKSNGYTIADGHTSIPDYAVHAGQIRKRIPTEPYRSDAAWKPVLPPDLPLRGGFEVLTVEALRAEAVRRTDSAADQWKRPPIPTTEETENPAYSEPSLWVNLYGTIPMKKQEEIYHQVFDLLIEPHCRPEYVYYELERAKIDPKEETVWQPVSIYPAGGIPPVQDADYSWDRLVPFGKQQNQYSLFLFSDFDVEPAKTYAYRIRLYLANPHYNTQETYVEKDVDTASPFIPSDWSSFTRVYVPDRTLVRLQSVTPTDSADFPRQTGPLRAVKGTVSLDYFDIELGQSLPLVEQREVVRGTLCNMSKADANKYIRSKTAEEIVNINYPDTGLRSNVCVLDFSGGRKLQKTLTREAQVSPDLFIAGKALLLMPDGTMQIITTEPELFR